MIERRSDQRMRTLKGAKILLPGHRSTIDCTVRNYSPAGAKLKLESTISVPDRFDLQISPGDELHPCRVAWRSLTEIGVRFTEAATAK